MLPADCNSTDPPLPPYGGGRGVCGWVGGWVSLGGWVGCLVLVLRQPQRDPPPRPPLVSKGLIQVAGWGPVEGLLPAIHEQWPARALTCRAATCTPSPDSPNPCQWGTSVWALCLTLLARCPRWFIGASSGMFYLRGSVSAPGIFFDPCPIGDLLRGALSAVQLFGRLAVLEPHTL